MWRNARRRSLAAEPSPDPSRHEARRGARSEMVLSGKRQHKITVHDVGGRAERIAQKRVTLIRYEEADRGQRDVKVMVSSVSGGRATLAGITPMAIRDMKTGKRVKTEWWAIPEERFVIFIGNTTLHEAVRKLIGEAKAEPKASRAGVGR